MKHSVHGREGTVCRATFLALLLLAGLSTSASGGPQVFATSYDLYNGSGSAGYGNVTLLDDTYHGGTGSNTTGYAYLAGGLGDLTDGTIATQNWSDCNGAIPCTTQNAPYVGWNIRQFPSRLPFVTFHFASIVNIDEVKLNSNNGYRPDPVDFSMTGGTATQSLTRYVGGDNTGPANLEFDFTNLAFTGDALTLTFHYHPAPYAADWILLSEVRFYSAAAAIPEPTSLVLLGIGLAGLGFSRRKQ